MFVKENPDRKKKQPIIFPSEFNPVTQIPQEALVKNLLREAKADLSFRLLFKFTVIGFRNIISLSCLSTSLNTFVHDMIKSLYYKH